MNKNCSYGLLLCTLIAGPVNAAIVTYTDPTAFNAAISGRSNSTLDFDSAAAGTTIANGGSLGGLSFVYDWGNGEQLEINNDNSTNSGSNYLGASSAGGGVDFVADGNNFTITPDSSASALGLYVITAIEALDGDLRLVSGANRVELVRPSLGTLADGSHVYFLGMVAAESQTVGSLTLEGDQFAFGLNYRVDGIQFSAQQGVPEPGSFLVVLGVGATIFRRRRHR